LTYSEATEVFEKLFRHEMSDEEMRNFLVTMKLDDSMPVEALAAAASVMRSHAVALPVDDALRGQLIDIVGTGGDKIGSFNISSTVALLCASMGAYVAKHGSRSVTSKSGSADMFEALGVRLDLPIEQSARLLEETGFTFMFAQNHHPAMKFIMPIRKSIPDKTIFNVLGPLTNPAGVQKIMLGVFDKTFVPKIAEALRINNVVSAMVVSSQERMDEISISGITHAARVDGNGITEYEIDPQMHGIKRQPLEAIVGGDAGQNARILQNIFNDTATDAQRDIVMINAANAFIVDGKARDVQEGLEMAREAVRSGKAKAKLEQIVAVSSKL
jgi:anthranilate phosphoribosyltransferase